MRELTTPALFGDKSIASLMNWSAESVLPNKRLIPRRMRIIARFSILISDAVVAEKAHELPHLRFMEEEHASCIFGIAADIHFKGPICSTDWRQNFL